MNCGCTPAATCGACAGAGYRTPRRIDNRFGLPAVAYRSGRFPDFRSSLLTGLTMHARPGLAALQTRETDDETIALIDAFACVCDVLTFYTERLANESYLRTATDPTSLQELGRLLGYRPAPGAAAQTYLAVTLERPPDLPAPLSADPGLVPAAVPAAVELPVGLRVMSVPGPGEQPVTFETVGQLDARPAWNSLAARAVAAPTPAVAADGAWFAGSAPALKTGDLLLFVGNPTSSTGYGAKVADNFALRSVTAVNTPFGATRTKVSWASQALGFTPAVILVLRTAASIFGASAPDWRSLRLTVKRQYQPSGTIGADWPDFNAVTADGQLDVDGSRPELVPGSWLVLDGPSASAVYRITKRSEQAKAGFAISGRVTHVTLAGPTLTKTPRELTCYGGGQLLTLTAGPDEAVTSTGVTTVTVDADLSGMLPGRDLILTGTTAAGSPGTEHVTLSKAEFANGSTTLTLTDGLRSSYRQAGLVLFGNVAPATHGTSVSQVLGDGRAAATGQSFTLKATPVTHVQSAGPSGTSSTLEISVDGIVWAQVPTLYQAASTDRTFITDRTAADESTVVFGDGRRGSRLPTGSQNIRARYRQGLGAAGNVAAGQLSLPLDRPLGLKAVSNPLPATGGVDPDGPEVARAKIPVSVRTLGRVVSVSDYADVALTFSGIAKAEASVLTLRSGLTIVVTVAGVDGAALAPGKITDLLAELRSSGDPHVALQILPYQHLQFRIDAGLVINPERHPPEVLAAVRDALGSAFNFAHSELGRPVFRSVVIEIAQRVSGVLGVDLNRLHRRGTVPSLQTRLQAAPATVDSQGAARPAQLLTIDPTSLTNLRAIP